jgi:hypothetical protein
VVHDFREARGGSVAPVWPERCGCGRLHQGTLTMAAIVGLAGSGSVGARRLNPSAPAEGAGR